MADLATEAGLRADDEILHAAGKLFTYLWDTAWQHSSATAGGDADALHDMRVAIRRLRSALQNFEGPRNGAAFEWSIAPRTGRRAR
jgi:CHAD domain-containing protein